MVKKTASKKALAVVEETSDVELEGFDFMSTDAKKLKRNANKVLRKASPYQLGVLTKLEQKLTDCFEFEAAEYVSDYAPGLAHWQFSENLIECFYWDETTMPKELWAEIYWSLIASNLEQLHSAVYANVEPTKRTEAENRAKNQIGFIH